MEGLSRSFPVVDFWIKKAPALNRYRLVPGQHNKPSCAVCADRRGLGRRVKCPGWIQATWSWACRPARSARCSSCRPAVRAEKINQQAPTTRHSGNDACLTSLPLISVRHHGDINRWKSRENSRPSGSSVFCTIWQDSTKTGSDSPGLVDFPVRQSGFHRSLAQQASVVENVYESFDRRLNFALVQHSFRQVGLDPVPWSPISLIVD